ncbi:hypothetical protein CORC01_00359 [Colletotrichum orchidophilum]|uniref:Uncharacterized protein n=1 Tax=Colletotrichum orchidophilum TaxID=1209926 RepID=A0A1G4BTC6_9PEZI|nr:uncharacterized protein CORC01_00359 [Colletotrichum orchidophilum]OHF04507.1 hypothetical protein CORC01_00359 [Colletotrichum orchidophilum]
MRSYLKLRSISARMKCRIKGTTLPGGFLPYELWLEIVDAMVDDLESTIKPISWILKGIESEQGNDGIHYLLLDQRTHLWFNQTEYIRFDKSNNWNTVNSMRRCHALEPLQNLMLVDRGTRQLVNRRLPRCSFFLVDPHRKFAVPRYIRIVPGVDLFRYDIHRRIPQIQMDAVSALIKPYEDTDALLHVHTILLSATILEPNDGQLLKTYFRYLQKMPRLKNVEFRGLLSDGLQNPTAYFVENTLLSFLAKCNYAEKDEIVSIWRPLRDRGVKFTVNLSAPF